MGWNITQPLKRKILPFVTTRMGLEDIMLREMSEKDMISLTRGV